MNKFKVGDHVRVYQNNPFHKQSQKIGTLLAVDQAAGPVVSFGPNDTESCYVNIKDLIHDNSDLIKKWILND